MTVDPWEIAAREFEPSPISRYMYDPAAWARDCVNWEEGGGLTFYQDDILAQLAEHRRVAVRGPHGLGKTALSSFVIWWFATTRDAAGIDWKVITTASAWRQLTVFLWPELHKWSRIINWDALGRKEVDPRRELLDLNLKLKYGAGSAVASNDPSKIEGAHADSLLYLVDEAKTVPPETWDAIEGAFSGGTPAGLPEAFAIAFSTPGPTAGRFYDIHTRKPGLEDWKPIHVTLDDAVKAGRIAPSWAEQRARQWGKDSAIYATRVLGEFHQGDDDTLIPLSWVEAAQDRWRDWDDAGRPALEGRSFLGVDIARTGGDETVFAYRTGDAITRIEPVNSNDTMATTARIQAAVALGGATPVVDSAGVGGGVVDRLRELQRRGDMREKVLAYTGAAKAKTRDLTKEFGFTNTRSAAYWNLRELLDPARDSQVILPPSDELTADLTVLHWDITSGTPPKIRIETKEDILTRLGRSPDRGDAVAMAFYADAMRTQASVGRPSAEFRMPVSGVNPLARR